MKNSKKSNKLLSLFTALLLAFVLIVPNSSLVYAANELQVAQYVSIDGTTNCGATKNTAVFNGTWKASIPMGKVMSGIENKMKEAADSGYYPHGKDGAYKIAYVEYAVTFPTGVTIDGGGIQKTNTTAMFNANAFSHSVNGQVVTFKFPLKDVNWKGVYDFYI